MKVNKFLAALTPFLLSPQENNRPVEKLSSILGAGKRRKIRKDKYLQKKKRLRKISQASRILNRAA